MASIPDPLFPPVAKMRDLIASPQAIPLPWEGYMWDILAAQDFNPRSLSISGNITIPLGEFLVRKPLWELINGESPSDLTVDWTHYRARVVLPISENFDTSVVDRAFKVNLEWMTLRLCGFLRAMERHLELPLGYIQERRSAIHQQIEDVVSGYPRQEITNHCEPAPVPWNYR